MAKKKKFIYYFLGWILLLLLWYWASAVYPAIIVPPILDTCIRIAEIFWFESGVSHIGITVLRAAVGFVLSLIIGLGLGILSGYFDWLRYLLFPIERVMISVPPIVWIILILIWFGGDGIISPATTVFVAHFPFIYLATIQGVRTIDDDLFKMAKSFKLPFHKALVAIGGMHILSLTLPAITLVLGSSWKVAIMAEVLGSPNGIGAQITNARVNLETVDVFAWVIVIIVFYLISDKLLISPLNHYTMKWR